MSLPLLHEPHVVPPPERISEHGRDHAYEDAEEAETRLRKGETMIVHEHERESTEKQVYYAEKYCRQRA